MTVVDTYSVEQTLTLGEHIGNLLKPGSIVCLSARLGVGKTWFTKGIVKGVNNYEQDQVTSPAFNLVNEYPAARANLPTVLHIDFYRLDELTPNDVQMFEEYLLDDSAVAIVEWGDKFLPQLVSDYLNVSIEMFPDDDKHRRFTFDIKGQEKDFVPLLDHLASPWQP